MRWLSGVPCQSYFFSTMAGQQIHLPSLLWASNTETHPNAARLAFDSQSCAPPSLRRFQHTTSPTSSSSRSQQVLRTGVAFSVPLKGDELPAVLRTRESEDDTNEVLHDKAAAGQADGQRPHHARQHFSNRLLPTLPPCLCSCLRARACTRAHCVRSVSSRRVASPRFASFRPVSPRIAPPRLA